MRLPFLNSAGPVRESYHLLPAYPELDYIGLKWSAAQPDLVTVWIAVRDLAHSVRVGLPLRGIESSVGYLCDERIEVIDEERVHGVASVVGLLHLHDVQVPVLRKLPYGLCVVWKECGRPAQQLLVSFQCRRVVSNGDSSKQVQLRGLNHACCPFQALVERMRGGVTAVGAPCTHCGQRQARVPLPFHRTRFN